MSGTYVLIADLPRATTIDVGALGAVEFAAGTYAYVGSAFGPGGFARVDSRRSEAPTKSHSLRSRDHHRELAAGDRDTRCRSKHRRSLTRSARENATGTSTICSAIPGRLSRPRSRSRRRPGVRTGRPTPRRSGRRVRGLRLRLFGPPARCAGARDRP